MAFVRGQDAPKIWDPIAEGKSMGIILSASSVLDMLRVEATCCSTPTTIHDVSFAGEQPGDPLGIGSTSP
jgi:hypothetical protein